MCPLFTRELAMLSEDKKHVWDEIQLFKIRMFLIREWGAQTPRAALVLPVRALSTSNYVVLSFGHLPRRLMMKGLQRRGITRHGARRRARLESTNTGLFPFWMGTKDFMWKPLSQIPTLRLAEYILREENDHWSKLRVFLPYLYIDELVI